MSPKTYLSAECSAGKVVDVSRRTSEGFATGEMRMEGMGTTWDGGSLRILFQNENLAVWERERLLACVPDLICFLETEIGYYSSSPLFQIRGSA